MLHYFINRLVPVISEKRLIFYCILVYYFMLFFVKFIFSRYLTKTHREHIDHHALRGLCWSGWFVVSFDLNVFSRSYFQKEK